MKWIDSILRIIGIGERRSVENPSTSLADPDQWLIDAWGGTTHATIQVGTNEAMSYSPVNRAVNLIARDVAKLPPFPKAAE